MKTIKYLLPWVTLAAGLATSPIGFAGAFTNGSFENVSGVQLQPHQEIVLPRGDSRLLGWTIGGTGGAVTVINATVPNIVDFLPVDGANQLDFNGGDTAPGTWISQTFDTVVGANYTVSLYLGHTGDATARLSLTVIILPSYGPALVWSNELSPPAHGYGSKQNFSFTATSSTTTLHLVDTSADTVGADLLLDAVTVVQVGQAPANIQLSPSTDDLWDVSRGVIITGQSEMRGCAYPMTDTPFDARDIFGGNFSPICYLESQDAIFADGMPDGFVHYVEWATPSPVTIRSFNLWAIGGYPPDSQEREFASFRLLAKSPNSITFDLVLYTSTPSHPYKFVQDIYALLVSTDIKPTTARQFRAEFVNRVMAGHCCDGPRVIELDGFGDFIGPSVSIRTSEAEISWDSVPSLKYQVEYREDLPSSNWTALGAPVVGDGGTMRVTDKIAPGQTRRFYRVRATE